MKADKKFILIDSNAIMHRAFHALPPLTTKSGQLVGVVYGFTSVLLRIIKDLQPDYIACAFDVAGGTFRDAIFAEYKAGRKKPDQEFYDQIDSVKEVVRALSIPIFERAGFEADDIIGTLARKLSEMKNIEVFIATGDMDALQLVDERVKVYSFKKGISETIIYDASGVEARYGIRPDQIIDYKALRGDTSDNIPGVKGVGEKTATLLLQEFGTLDRLYARIEQDKDLDSIRPKMLATLRQEKDCALMSRDLATIKCDMNLDFRLEDCVWGNYDKSRVVETFQRYEFFSLLARLGDLEKGRGEKSAPSGGAIELIETPAYIKAPAAAVVAVPVQCHVVRTEPQLSALLEKFQRTDTFVLKTVETQHLIAERHLVGIIFAFDPKEIFYVPIPCESAGAQSLFEEKPVDNGFLQRLIPVLEDSSKRKSGFDLKKDAETLAAYDIALEGLEFDAMLAAYLLDPGKRDYGEEKLLFDQLGLSGECELLTSAKEEVDCAWGRLTYIFELRRRLEGDLEAAGMDALFHRIEMPLIRVLCELEMTGVLLDTQLLQKISQETDEEIGRLTNKIHELAGDAEFNLNSSRQLADVLFNKLKLSAADIKKGKTGYSVAASELEKLREGHPIIDFIGEYRELFKLKNTYIDTLPKLVNPRTGRLHTTFNQDVTSTGRLSSSDPNLQNIPVRTPIGRRIREAFVAEEGRIMLSADYSQIELRIIATIADDARMQEIFQQDLDIHSATASRVNNVPLEEVTPAMRRAAKALNFGVIYGMSVFGFARSAGIDRAAAKLFIDNYMQVFSQVAQYIENSKLQALEKGYAETLWGRRRYLPELRSRNALVRSAAERMAINMPIQGTAADLMKINMIKIFEWAEDYNAQHADAVRVLLQVHDELLFSVQAEYMQEVSAIVKQVMENGHVKFDGHDIDFAVPIKVSLKSGKNWGVLE
jgi:DNA polymerase-1